MALTQRLDLRQSQSLVMTPQLQQAIKLLQLSNIELTAYVDKELAENPLLELVDEDGGDAPDALEQPVEAETPLAPTDKVTNDAAPSDTADQALDLDQGNLWNAEKPADAAEPEAGWQLGSWGEPGGQAPQDGHAADWEDIASAPESLRNHLMRQVQTEIDDGEARLIAAYLVDCLDEAGYLTVSVAEVALALGTTTDRVADALEQCQRFDPPGLFARSLRECLALQLAERNRLDPAMATMLDHLDLLAQRNHAVLGRLCGLDRSDIIDMVGEIRALNPKPAERFTNNVAQTVVPDVIVTGDGARGWAVRL
ncbi:MAG: RNA polymerase sigma-54 factor, partial [Pseudomonadota bacterium]